MDHRLQIVLTAKDVTGTAFKKLRGRFQAITKSVFSFRSALGALTGAGGLGYLVKSSISAADSIAKTADKLGITTTALQEYRYAAERSGVQTSTLDMALQRFTRRVGEAAIGKGELKDTLLQYNIAVTDAEGRTRDTTAVLNDLADVIQNTENPAERLRIAFKAFDSEGAALVNMLRNGSAGLDEFKKRAAELGIILDDSLTRKSEKATDAFTDLTAVLKTEFSKAVVENIDAITQAMENMIAVVAKLAKWASLRSILGTAEQAAQLAKQGMINMQQFMAADFFARQRMVDEALRDLAGTGVQTFKFPTPPRPSTYTAPPPMPTRAKGGAAEAGPQFEGMLAIEEARFLRAEKLIRDHYETVEDTSKEAYEAMDAHVQDWQRVTENTYTTIDRLADNTFSHASNALADFTTSGKFNFSDFANSIISDLIRIQARMLLSGLWGSVSGGFGAASGAAPTGQPLLMQSGGYLGEGVVGVGTSSGRSYAFHSNEWLVPGGKMGGNVEVIVNNNSGQPGNVREGIGAGGTRQIFVTIGNDITRGGPIAGAMERTYGLTRTGRTT